MNITRFLKFTPLAAIAGTYFNASSPTNRANEVRNKSLTFPTSQAMLPCLNFSNITHMEEAPKATSMSSQSNDVNRISDTPTQRTSGRLYPMDEMILRKSLSKFLNASRRLDSQAIDKAAPDLLFNFERLQQVSRSNTDDAYSWIQTILIQVSGKLSDTIISSNQEAKTGPNFSKHQDAVNQILKSFENNQVFINNFFVSLKDLEKSNPGVLKNFPEAETFLIHHAYLDLASNT